MTEKSLHVSAFPFSKTQGGWGGGAKRSPVKAQVDVAFVMKPIFCFRRQCRSHDNKTRKKPVPAVFRSCSQLPKTTGSRSRAEVTMVKTKLHGHKVEVKSNLFHNPSRRI